MRDLLVAVQSRGRQERLREMIEACLSLSEADTDIAVGIDDDDPSAGEYEAFLRAFPPGYVFYTKAERRTLGAWTNRIAAANAGQYRAFASLGDDHIPRTMSWDGLLLEALDNLNDAGSGIAYGNDQHQGQALPTAPVISSDIVEALGWMCEPSLRHMFVDNVWRDLGRAANCLAYVPGVVTEHQHPDAGKAVSDETYAASLARTEADRQAYERWRNERMAGDVEKVRALLGR
jgi:hypothetical protein